jgi:hypothetical protein
MYFVRPRGMIDALEVAWIDPQRAWQRRANPVCLALLHLAPESRHGSYVVIGAANGNADERLSQARRLADVYCYCTSGTAN